MVQQELELQKEPVLKLKNKMEEDTEIKISQEKKREEKSAEAMQIREETPKEKKKEDIEKIPTEKSQEEKKEKTEEKSEKKNGNVKKEKPKTKFVKKDEAFVKGVSLPISTKTSVAICRFIKGKTINQAVDYLEEVAKGKKVMPMKGEIPHRKGKGIMSGRYPKRASEHFIKLLRSLSANSNNNGIENPIMVEAVANVANKPFGRFGRTRKKRTHVSIKVMEKSKINKQKKNKEKK